MPGGLWMTGPCHRLHVACGFIDMPPLSNLNLVLDPGRFLTGRGGWFLKRGAQKIALSYVRSAAVRRASREMRKLTPGMELQEISTFDPELDGVWKRLLEDYGVGRVREAAYLNWKYANHPVLRYRCLIAKRRGHAVGYLVWRPAPEGATERRAAITDFLLEKGDEEAFRLLISRVIIDSASAGMEIITTLSSQPWIERILRKFGFLPRRFKSAWVIAGWRNLFPEEWTRTHSPWYICLGDSDGDLWTGSQ